MVSCFQRQLELSLKFVECVAYVTHITGDSLNECVKHLGEIFIAHRCQRMLARSQHEFRGFADEAENLFEIHLKQILLMLLQKVQGHHKYCFPTSLSYFVMFNFNLTVRK